MHLGRDPLDVRQGQSLRPRPRRHALAICRIADNIVARPHRPCCARTSRPTGRVAARRLTPSTPRGDVIKRGIALTPVKFGISFHHHPLSTRRARWCLVYSDGSGEREPRRHRDGPGADGQGRAGRGRRLRRSPPIAIPHLAGHPHRQSAQHLGHRRLIGRGPQLGTSHNAAMTIRDRLTAFAARTFGCGEGEVGFTPDGIVVAGEILTFGEASPAGTPRPRIARLGDRGLAPLPGDRGARGPTVDARGALARGGAGRGRPGVRQCRHRHRGRHPAGRRAAPRSDGASGEIGYLPIVDQAARLRAGGRVRQLRALRRRLGVRAARRGGRERPGWRAAP